MYQRLSADEGEEESNSVKNQKILMDYYLKNNKDIKIYKQYIDDGYTGTDFDRPAYKEMLNDIEKGKIDGIIVKDLSRLGRNYILVGNFIEDIIPKYKLRFISVNDNVDSYLNPESLKSLIIPFKNLLNESYSSDSSKKIRSSLKASKKSGNFIGRMAPFGYKKDDNDIHLLVIDEDAAKVVKKIFSLALEGNSKVYIAEYLNKKNVLTPSKYLNLKNSKYKPPKIKNQWDSRTVDYILRNEVYIGNLVQCKRERVSHKKHNIVVTADEDKIRVENTHKGIIDKRTFNKVHNILINRNTYTIKKNINIFSGYIKCKECGSSLVRGCKMKHNKKRYFYQCNSYHHYNTCTRHFIYERLIEDIVLDSINKQINLFCDFQKIKNNIIDDSISDYKKQINEMRIVELDKQIIDHKKLINGLLKDYKNDVISEKDYLDFKEHYLYELNQLENERSELNVNFDEGYSFLKKIKIHNKITVLNRNIINEFIENIYVDENKNVTIEFKYQDEYNHLLNYINDKKM